MRTKRNAPVTVDAMHRGECGVGTTCHYITRFVASAILLSSVLFLSPVSADADSPGWEPETVSFGIVEAGPVQTPVPSPASGIDVNVSETDVEILARLLWSSPLTNETDKRNLCWLVFNRIDDETYGLFGSTIETVVIRREFTFYDSKAYLSETNLRIAREELRRWNLYLIGAVKERLLDADYLYAAFNGHHVEFKKSK
jgi:hypothetical protein